MPYGTSILKNQEFSTIVGTIVARSKKVKILIVLLWSTVSCTTQACFGTFLIYTLV